RMSKRTAFFVLVALFVATPTPSMAQPHSTNGMRGTHASAKRKNFKDLPIYTPDPTAPIREVRELEAPESPFVPPVDISNLNQVTMDPSSSVSAPPPPTAPSVGSVNFEGITQGGFIPSEPTVAAGPLNIFTLGNSSITVTNKDGSNRTEVNGLTFFGGPVSEVAISDGVCMYDARRGHF